MRLYTFAICLPTSLPRCDRGLPPTAARLSRSQTQESCSNKTTDKLTFFSILPPPHPTACNIPPRTLVVAKNCLPCTAIAKHTPAVAIKRTTPYNLMLVSFIPVRFAPLFDGSWMVNHIDHSSSPRGSAGNLLSRTCFARGNKMIAFRHIRWRACLSHIWVCLKSKHAII